MRTLILVTALVSVLSLAGCGHKPSLLAATATCQKYVGTYPVQYLGNAYGRGELEIRATQGRPDLIDAKMTLWDETGTDAVINLGGPGSCDDGILRIRFGGGDHPKAKIKVLGGSLVAVPEPKLFSGMFGGWEVKVLMKEKNTERTLQGFLRQKTKPVTAGANPAKAGGGAGS